MMSWVKVTRRICRGRSHSKRRNLYVGSVVCRLDRHEGYGICISTMDHEEYRNVAGWKSCHHYTANGPMCLRSEHGQLHGLNNRTHLKSRTY